MHSRHLLTGALCAGALAFTVLHRPPAAATSAPPALLAPSVTEIPAAALVQPASLAADLHSAHPPLIFQVGPRSMFDQAHIAGAEYAGAAAQPDGLTMLRARVSHLPRHQPIVLYCGCCPWDRCPNIRPAFQALTALGFDHVRALYLASNFGTDWVTHGYPTEPQP